MTGRWTAALASLVVLGLASPGWTADAPIAIEKPAVAEPAGSIGRVIDDFKLSDFQGQEVSLSGLADQRLVVVAFLGVECPLAKLYTTELVTLQKIYARHKVAFLAIDANRQDSTSEMAAFAKTHKLDFPFLKDVGNAVADKIGATRTPEVFVLDESRTVRYSGRVDDRWQVGVQRKEPTRRDLVAAIDQLLAKRKVAVERTEPIGCLIGRTRQPDPNSKVTYSKEIVRIFQNRCIECHHEGDIAPFAMDTYTEAAGWADMIAEVVDNGTMPPWHASSEHGTFANDARLSAEEKAAILEWAAAGAPEGNPADMPPAKVYEKGWRIGQPDVVYEMAEKPFEIPATGEVPYQHFVIDPGFTEDKWVQAAECIPGNRGVVHHIILSVRTPGRNKDPKDVPSDWLCATAPGARPLILPEGYAKKIPAGARLIFQVHYTPNGSPQSDLSKVGLKFCDASTVKREVGTQKAGNNRFTIPANADAHVVEATEVIKRDSMLLVMFPHMHLRGKSFRYEAQFPDGRKQVLLDVPEYHFDWQNAYIPTDPILLPTGTVMHCRAVFDNSKDNPNNPDPSKAVTWGDQTWEEMMIGYYDVSEATDKVHVPSGGLAGGRTGEFLAKTGGKTPVVSEEVKKLAAAALDSQEAFTALGAALREVVPQADRMDFAVIENAMLSVKFDVQAKALDKYVKGRGLIVPVVGLAVPKYAEGSDVVVHQKLIDVAKQAPDLKLLSQAFSSSVHSPVRFNGKPAIVNFWSTEMHAFPPEAVEYLKQVAALMTAGR
ncbi:MAG TPA: redoxin domain-containing protein [Pirellulales bacterium]